MNPYKDAYCTLNKIIPTVKLVFFSNDDTQLLLQIVNQSSNDTSI